MDRVEFEDSEVWRAVSQFLHNRRLGLMDELRNASNWNEHMKATGALDEVDVLQALPDFIFSPKKER